MGEMISPIPFRRLQSTLCDLQARCRVPGIDGSVLPRGSSALGSGDARLRQGSLNVHRPAELRAPVPLGGVTRISPIRFALNRTCAPQKTLGEFIELAASSGVEAVEVRNDIAGREFADGTSAEVLRDQLEGAGLRLASAMSSNCAALVPPVTRDLSRSNLSVRRSSRILRSPTGLATALLSSAWLSVAMLKPGAVEAIGQLLD